MKDGKVDVEATNAYNEAILNGSLPKETNAATQEAELLKEILASLKNKKDPITGADISSFHVLSILSGLAFSYRAGRYRGKKLSIPNPDKKKKKDSGANIKSDDIKFGSSVKSIKKVNNQMKKRGWSEETVKSVVDHPYTTRKSVNKATGNDATVFYDKDGSYVIIDDKTKEIVQISDKFDKNWVPDAGIVDPYKPKGGK